MKIHEEDSQPPQPTTHCLRRTICASVIFIGFLACSVPEGLAQVNVLTYHNDGARTGVNPNETVLTPANVTPAQFGRLFSQAVDGYVYAQPLVVTGVSIEGKGVHDVVFVATEHNSVYAFDAHDNTGANANLLWQVNLGPSVPSGDVGSGDVVPEIGITSTPVIDPNTGVLYVVAKTKEDFNYFQRLHALEISSGAERPGSPVVIEATVPGTGDGSVNGEVSFDPLRHMNRPGLLLSSGVVYIAFASHGDVIPYHGWVFGYDAETLKRVSVFNTTPNGLTDPSGYPIGGGGIWQAGGAPAADADGNLYVITGNGTFDAAPSLGSGIDYGDTFLKLSLSDLTVVDYFTPFNQDFLNRTDTDLGSSGPLVLPDSAGSAVHPHLLVGAGKEGTIYLVDRDNMGQFTDGGPDQIVQVLPFFMGGAFGSPAFFNGNLYYNGTFDSLKAFRIVNGQIDPPYPVSQAFNFVGFPGATPSVSANDTADGIVWILDNGGYGGHFPTILHAYDATDLTRELYNSAQVTGRDTLGPAVKFTTPTVANGKVYVGAQYELNVLGLANFPPRPQITLTPDSAANPVGTTHTVTAQVTDTVGVPRFGATVRFEVVSGPNAGRNSDADGGCSIFGCQTDFNGNVQWSYVSNGKLGTDQIEACTPDPQNGTPQCAQVAKEWVLPPDSFTFPDFSTSQGLSLVGSARTTDNRLRLTPADFDQTGAAWVSFRQPVGDGFDTTFKFQISDLGVTGADGFAFVIQNDTAGPSALGFGGGALGYSFLANSIAVEFDTWFNGEYNDPNENHVSVHTLGTFSNTADETFSLGSTVNVPDLSDGNVHTARIAYAPGDLQVFLDDLSTPILRVPADLGAILNLDHGHAWVGFTAATGGAYENHDILSWSYNRTLREICNDGLDNNGNGLVDDDDPDCQAHARPLHLGLTPATDVGPLNTPCTVTALITNVDGAPQSGMFVWFQASGANFVISGQQDGQNQGCNPPDCLTDANGEVQWTYLGGGFPGTDSISAFAYDAADRLRLEATATREWEAPPPPPPGNGDGLLGIYYDNIDFTGPSITRIDPIIFFDWGGDSPDPAIEPDTFSVHWTGLVQPQFSEKYNFIALTDDGFRLWVDGQLIIDSFIDQPPTFHSGSVPLFAGKKYSIQIDYYENGGGAVAQLFWTSPSTPFAIVPQSQLYSGVSTCEVKCSGDIKVCNDVGTCGAVVNYDPPTSTGNCGQISCTPPSGSIFPVGSTVVTCSEPGGANCGFTVTVSDCEAPKVTCSASASTLWPPNHDLASVGFKATAVDNCDGPISGSNIKVQVFSDEDELAPASGNFSPDADRLTATGTLRLRAECRGDADGRVYLIVARVTDGAGNSAFCTTTVTVPHDQSAKSVASVAAQATAAGAYAASHDGDPPPGYFVIGNGPILGPKQ
jgi:hypothetical protein